MLLLWPCPAPFAGAGTTAARRAAPPLRQMALPIHSERAGATEAVEAINHVGCRSHVSLYHEPGLRRSRALENLLGIGWCSCRGAPRVAYTSGDSLEFTMRMIITARNPKRDVMLMVVACALSTRRTLDNRETPKARCR